MNISFIAGLAQRLIGVCVVSLILWHATHLGGVPQGKVNVYVPRINDVLTIDDRPHPAGSIEKPVVCLVEPGKHMLRLVRRGIMVTEQEFTVESGKEITLVLHDRNRLIKPTASPESKPEATGPSGLAIRTRRSRRMHH